MSGVQWISIRRLKCHEVNKTLRIAYPRNLSWPDKAEKFSAIQNKAIRAFMRGYAHAVALFLIFTSLGNGNSLSLQIFDYEASLPSAYFLFYSSFVLLVLSMQFNHLTVAMSLKTGLAGQMKVPGFSVNAYEALTDQGENSLGVPYFLSNFFKEIIPVSAFLGTLLVILFLTGLIPFAALSYFIWIEQIQLVISDITAFEQRVVAAIGTVIVSFAATSIVLFQLPIPMKKNVGQIRWLFLYGMPAHPSDSEKFARWHKDKD